MSTKPQARPQLLPEAVQIDRTGKTSILEMYYIAIFDSLSEAKPFRSFVDCMILAPAGMKDWLRGNESQAAIESCS